MKKKFLIYSLIACMGFGAVSCEDMLSPDSERHSYTVAQDTLYSYWGIIRSMQNIAERYVLLGELRGDLVGGTAYLSDSIANILNFDMANATDGSCRYLKAADYYHVINSCNAYLASCDNSRTTGTLTPYMAKEAAQVTAIRAWTYLQLVQVYGQVPFYTEPLLTSDDINNFANSPKMVSVDNLVDELADGLKAAAQVEAEYGFPMYDEYGFKTDVAHSNKLMIPVNIILGDLYLARGSKDDCIMAAQYYYNYLSGNKNRSMIPAGGPIPYGYAFVGWLSEGETTPRYTVYDSDNYTPWTERGAQDRKKESITAIASSTNKLWGTVLRGVNDIYGFETEIMVSGSTSESNVNIYVRPKYNKKQIINSEAYTELAKAQVYEVYTGAGSQTTWQLTRDDKAGDARQYWLREISQTYEDGTEKPEKFITKQNPGFSFTTTFPMIYRKSMVWLRFAEALCNAGYPSYAFAILKDGLCDAESWLPAEGNTDYEVKAWTYTRRYRENDEDKTTTYPNEAYPQVKNRDDLVEQLVANVDFDNATARKDSITKLKAEIDSTAADWHPWPDPEKSDLIVNYIAADEHEATADFLDFTPTTFAGDKNIQRIVYRQNAQSFPSVTQETGETYEDPIVNGIHCRGNGYLKKGDRHNSIYNYVDMVAKKAMENYPEEIPTVDGEKKFTKEMIYDKANKDLVIKCVEDLIVDEEALELAFEGCRFFDLMRVAHRRGNPDYLAKRVSMRGGKENPNPALRSKLSNPNNWYFPLPKH